VAVEGTHTGVTGWRNNYDMTTPAAVTMGNPLIGTSAMTQVATPATTRNFWRMWQPIALKARESDTATQWFCPYGGNWNASAYIGWGYAKLMITAQKGDLNYDGKCDFNDLNALSAAWNSTKDGPGWNADADLDGDDKVDFNDLSPLSNVWNKQCGQ